MKSPDLAQLKKKTDLVAVAQARGLKLAKQGQDFVARCPFHKEASAILPHHAEQEPVPLLRVWSRRVRAGLRNANGRHPVQGRSGQALDRNRRCATRHRYNATGRSASTGPGPGTRRHAAGQSDGHLREEPCRDPEGRAYLEKRGITDAALWTRHRIGYSNGKLTELLPKEGPVWDELKTLGVLLPNGQERFTGCVVFPVFDAEGNLTTIYGRFTGQGDKRHLYLPGRPTGLWNAVALKTYGHVVFVESILDGLSVEMAGSQNVISIQGTNGLNTGDVETFASYGVQRVTLLMDGDEPAGPPPANCKPCFLPLAVRAGTCPRTTTLTATCWPTARRLLPVSLRTSTRRRAAGPGSSRTDHPAQAPPGVQTIPGGFAVMLGLRRYEIRGWKGPRKLKATVRVEHAGRLHVDTLDFYSARWRRQLAQDLCRVFTEPAEAIEADVGRLMALCESQPESQAAAVAAPVETHDARSPRRG